MVREVNEATLDGVVLILMLVDRVVVDGDHVGADFREVRGPLVSLILRRLPQVYYTLLLLFGSNFYRRCDRAFCPV